MLKDVRSLSELLRNLLNRLKNMLRFLPLSVVSVLLFTSVPSYAERNWFTDVVQKSLAAGEIENISITFVTIRNRTGSKDITEYFGGNRGELHTGSATVSFSPIRPLNDISDSIPFYIPDEKMSLSQLSITEPESLFPEVKKFASSDNGNIIIYTHGYNVDFEKGCKRVAIFQRALGLHDRLIYFSWPADGNMLKYTWDEADLMWSIPHMTRFFEDMAQRTGDGKLDIVAHSLGARGAVHALVRLAYREDVRKLVDNLVIIAPDIDVDVFVQELSLLKKVTNLITVYVSENDKALRLSKEVHGYPRLGESSESLLSVEGVEFIDISKITNRRISGHLYHLFSDEVIQDLISLLHTGKRAGERDNLEKIKGGAEHYTLRLAK